MASSKSVRKEIGIKIKDIREKQGLTQDDLAKKARISANYYAKIERGEVGTAVINQYRGCFNKYLQ